MVESPFLESLKDEISIKRANTGDKQYFICPNCKEQMVTLTGLGKEIYIANVAAYAYLLDKSIGAVFPLTDIILDDDDALSESVLEAADEYVRNTDDFNFDPETMKCDYCHTNIKAGVQEDLDKYIK